MAFLVKREGMRIRIASLVAIQLVLHRYKG